MRGAGGGGEWSSRPAEEGTNVWSALLPACAALLRTAAARAAPLPMRLPPPPPPPHLSPVQRRRRGQAGAPHRGLGALPERGAARGRGGGCGGRLCSAGEARQRCQSLLREAAPGAEGACVVRPVASAAGPDVPPFPQTPSHCPTPPAARPHRGGDVFRGEQSLEDLDGAEAGALLREHASKRSPCRDDVPGTSPPPGCAAQTCSTCLPLHAPFRLILVKLLRRNWA